MLNWLSFQRLNDLLNLIGWIEEKFSVFIQLIHRPSFFKSFSTDHWDSLGDYYPKQMEHDSQCGKECQGSSRVLSIIPSKFLISTDHFSGWYEYCMRNTKTIGLSKMITKQSLRPRRSSRWEREICILCLPLFRTTSLFLVRG